MTEREKLALLEDLFEADEGDLTPDTSLADLEMWDSMTKLSLIVLVSDECGKKLTADDIRGFETVGDILTAMG